PRRPVYDSWRQHNHSLQWKTYFRPGTLDCREAAALPSSCGVIGMYRWIVLSLAAIPIMLSAFRQPAPNFEWWTTHARQKDRPYDTVPKKVQRSVHISAARNEFESFQVVLRAETDEVEGLDLEAGDLKKSDGSVLSANNVTTYFVRYLDLPKPSSIEGTAGE